MKLASWSAIFIVGWKSRWLRYFACAALARRCIVTNSADPQDLLALAAKVEAATARHRVGAGDRNGGLRRGSVRRHRHRR
ncbi:hypothetical protein AB5I41_31010 [Sphingomonas sp. MMS24-JH45]